MTSAAYRVEFIPQLIAAIERHELCENFATWNSVMIARLAVLGEDTACEALREPCWQLDDEGVLP